MKGVVGLEVSVEEIHEAEIVIVFSVDLQFALVWCLEIMDGVLEVAV